LARRELSRADNFRLAAKHRERVGAFQCELEEWSMRGEPVKTSNTRLIALKFVEQKWCPSRKVPSVKIRRVGGWTFDGVRKTNPVGAEYMAGKARGGK